MTPEQWQRIEELFQQAVELPFEEQEAFLDNACGADSPLRKEIQSLLANDEFGFNADLANVISDVAQSLPAPQDRIGQFIGNYRIIERIGQGGMGIVYRAVREDQGFRKEVALKLVSQGIYNEFLHSKFRTERGILARLEHPFIARFLDGGNAEDGTPYFAMEFVSGLPIIEYCRNANLSIADRLRLFRNVCSAVQYLHQHLIIHRDLKPSNILVARDGLPKLLDFGIAKLLTPEYEAEGAAQTMTLLRMMTPDYASPEQVLAKPITTASDIYSLGALLFELLTDQRAHQFKSYTPTEIERIVCRTEIEKPSSKVEGAKLKRLLSGDLDNIVLTAMRKEPGRRYVSVEQFSQDIRRHLEHLPVVARPDTLVYLSSKFIARHKWGIAAVALVIVSLLGGIFVANHEAKRAERRFQEVRKLANTFLFDFHDKIRDLPGSTEARETVVKTALEYLDSLSREAEGDGTLLAELADAYEKVGNVQGSPYEPNLGHSVDALQSYRKALEIRKKLAEDDPNNLKVLRSLSMAYYNTADLESVTGRLEAAIQNYQAGLGVAQTVLEAKSGDPEDYRLLSRGHSLLGDTQVKVGKAPEGLENYKKGLAMAKVWASKLPGDRPLRAVANSSIRVGHALVEIGDLLGAVKNYQESVKVNESRRKNHPQDAVLREDLLTAYMALGHVLGNSFMSIGDTASALEYTYKSLAMAEEMVQADPKNARARLSWCVSYSRLGDLLTPSDPVKAIEALQQSLSISDSLLESDPQNAYVRMGRTYTYQRLAFPLRKLNQHDKALQYLTKALEIQQKLTTADPADTQIQQDMIVTYNLIGDVLLEQNKSEQALENFRKALNIAEPMRRKALNLYAIRDLADCYERFGKYHAIKDNRDEARAWYQKSLNIWNDWTKHAVSSPFNTRRTEEVRQALLALK